MAGKRIVVVDEFPWHAIDKYASIDITPVYSFDVAEWIESMKREGYEIVGYIKDEEIAKALSGVIDKRIKRYNAWRQGDEFLVVEKRKDGLVGWYVTVTPP
jgi:hypothetical protein